MATQIQGMQGTQPPMSAVPALAEAVRPVGTSVAVAGSTTGEMAVQPANKSLRVKYRCGGCAAPVNVWGKPGLNLICGECQQSFAAQ
jgi:ribosomal protein S27E